MFYIEDYKELIFGQEYLFINVSGDYVGQPFKGSGVYAMLRRLERKTGIKASPICFATILQMQDEKMAGN